MKRIAGLVVLTASLGLMMTGSATAQDSLNMFSYSNTPGAMKDIW